MWDEYGEDELGFTCRGYPVFAMLLMRAGAAMPPRLRDVFLDTYVSMLNETPCSTTFVTRQVYAEIKRYDVRGGRTFRLPFELPKELMAANGPRFRVLSNNHESLARDIMQD